MNENEMLEPIISPVKDNYWSQWFSILSASFSVLQQLVTCDLFPLTPSTPSNCEFSLMVTVSSRPQGKTGKFNFEIHLTPLSFAQNNRFIQTNSGFNV